MKICLLCGVVSGDPVSCCRDGDSHVFHDIDSDVEFRVRQAHRLPAVRLYGLSLTGYLKWSFDSKVLFKPLGLAVWAPPGAQVRQLSVGPRCYDLNVDARFFGLMLSFDELGPLVRRGQVPESLLSFPVLDVGMRFVVTLTCSDDNTNVAVWGYEYR